MPAGARINVTLPDGKEMILSQGVGDAIGVVVIDRDNRRRDLSGDTLSVAAKLGTTSKTLAFTADPNQTTTGKGDATLVIPSAQLDALETLYVDLKVQKSGGEANIVKRFQFTVEDSAAD